MPSGITNFFLSSLMWCCEVSARSLGDINVQLIMEYLGGGGHSTVAGAQVKDKNVDMVIEDVEKAVFDYVANNES